MVCFLKIRADVFALVKHVLLRDVFSMHYTMFVLTHWSTSVSYLEQKHVAHIVIMDTLRFPLYVHSLVLLCIHINNINIMHI